MKLKIIKDITLEIEVLQTSKEIPEYMMEDFKEWLSVNNYQIGNHVDYYCVDEDYKNDIEVVFTVKSV